MNILLVYHELGFRGGEKVFSNLAKGLILHGNRVYWVIGRARKDSTELDKKIEIIKPVGVLNNLFQNNWLFVLFSMPVTFMNIILHRSKFDVIYCGEAFTVFWPAILASKLLRKRLVLSVFELGKNKTDTFLLDKVKYAVTINSTLIPDLKGNFKIKNVYLIPAGIDFTDFENPKPQKVIDKYDLKGKKIILMQGLLHPVKRQDLAIQAFHLAKRKIPNLALIVAGGGDQNYLKKIKTPDVIFTGFVEEKNVKNYYAASDICLMCGPIGGLTIIEALYFGKNIIYPTSGNPPLGPVEEYGLGIITKKKSADEFAKYIVDILKNPKKYDKKLGKDRKFILNKFSLETFTRKTLQVLEAER